MIKTLKGNNGSYAGLGSIQIQPSPVGSVDYEAQAQASQPQSDSSPGPVPVRQAALPVPVLLHSTGSIAQLRNPSLSDMAALAVNDPTFVFPLGSTTNNVVPTYAVSQGARTYDPRAAQDRPQVTSKFTPFELLTGISHERPEIVMLTNFVPLFDKDRGAGHDQQSERLKAAGYRPHITDAGRYLEAQFHLRALHTHNAGRYVSELRRRYSPVDQLATSRSNAFTDALRVLQADANFLLNAARMVEDGKKKLDLRNDAYLVKEPASAARFIAKNFRQLWSPTLPAPTPAFSSRASEELNIDIVEFMVMHGARHSFDFRDCMHDLGYSQAAVNNTFSSTKIWLQTLYELKQALQNHTLRLLDIDPTYQRQDSNPSSVLRPAVKYFGISPTVPALPAVSELINLQVPGTAQAISTLQAAFGSIYQNAHFKSEEARIAALAHLVTREFRYSYGLSLKPVQDALSRFYGVQVLPTGNTAIFDRIIGTFGNNISDLPDAAEDSLVTVGQSQPAPNTGVLTFEPKYLEGDTGTLTPGGDYYFDRIMSQATLAAFDTSGCDALLKQAEDQANQLLVIIDGLNLMMVPSRYDPRRPGSARSSDANFLGHPTDIVFELATQLINTSTGKVLAAIEHDRLGAVYARARNDARLKTILFLYTMARISRAYGQNVPFLGSNMASDNTPLVDNLIDRLVSSLESSVPLTQATVQLVTQPGLDKGQNTAALTPDSIKHALKAGTAMTRVIEQFMSGVIDWFRNRTSAIQDGHTRYAGYVDTLMMMVAFDLAIAMAARYSDQQLVGQHRGLSGFSQGQTTFAVAQAATNHAPSFNEVVQRHNREGDLIRQLLLTVSNSLLITADLARSTGNYFKGEQARSMLTSVSKGLGNDVSMLRMLLTEQQIMLLATTVENLLAAHRTGGEVSALDDSAVSPEMEEALLGYFSAADYASQSGINKRILTVGIPHGFAQLLKQKVDLRDQKRATFQEKRSDIVQVVVYKVDMQHTDVVYRPLRFLFELSRFPTRFTTAHWLPLKREPGLSDIISSIPTQCFTLDSDGRSTTASGVEYASTAIAGGQGVKGARAAFDDPAYSFLTPAQKAQLLHNHVVSQLLEAYVKLMTGMSVAEYTFHVVEPPTPMADKSLMSALVQHGVALVAERAQAQGQSSAAVSGGVMFGSTASRPAASMGGTRAGKGQASPILSNPAGTAGNVQQPAQFRSTQQPGLPTKSLEQQSAVGSVDSNLGSLGAQNVSHATHVLRTASRLGNTLTQLTGPDALNYRVLCPKQFDRVFSVIFDARDFEIDTKRTMKTPFGREALDLMIRNGDAVPVGTPNYLEQQGYNRWGSLVPEAVIAGRRPPQGRTFPNVNDYRFRSRDKSRGDLVTDRYFVTIETLEESDDA